MNAARLDEEAIYHLARKLSEPTLRATYLDQVCADDAALRGRVEALLRVSEQEASFLEVPACTVTMQTPSEPERPGTTIGPYKLLEQIGEGGMGTVFMAEQTEPVRRKVALKLIKVGMDSRQVIARFEAERQALALMDHANVARVFDAGTTESGRPYFVMELVRGLPITEFCDRERLSVPQRLELFIQVCRSVQHAHQKGIIHRDIKPTNVLVTLHDGVAVPKIIDFGVAKAVGQSLTDKTLHTGFLQMVGTPLYMSPEQAELSGLDVDTRSDIYSLGVLLYELLTGTTPFDRETFKKAALDEVRRIIREVEPPTPSTRLGTMWHSTHNRGAEQSIPSPLAGEGRVRGRTPTDARHDSELSTAASLRSTDPRKLVHTLRGELDWIVMRCLDKDRKRRYDTANALARDIERHLADEAVEACPPSTWYRFKKYTRRHRVALTTAIIVSVALVAGTAIATWQAIEARRARGDAVAKRDLARRVVDDMYTNVAEQWLVHQPRLEPMQRGFLLKALALYESFAAEEPADIQSAVDLAAACLRVGGIRLKLGETSLAEEPFRRGIALLEQVARRQPTALRHRLDLAGFHNNLADLLVRTGRVKDGVENCERAVGILQALVEEKPDNPEFRGVLGTTLANLARWLPSPRRDSESRTLLDRSVAIQEELANTFPLNEGHRHNLAQVLISLATHYWEMGRAPDAELLYERAITIEEVLLTKSPRNPEYRNTLAAATNGLGVLLKVAGKAERAEVEYRKTVALRSVLAAEYPSIPAYRKGHAEALYNLGLLLRVKPGQPEAEDVSQSAVEALELLVSLYPEIPDYDGFLGMALNNVGLFQLDRRDFIAARKSFERALRFQLQAIQADPTQARRTVSLQTHYRNLLRTLIGAGDRDAAVALAKEAILHAADKSSIAADIALILMIAVGLPPNDPDRSTEAIRADVMAYSDCALDCLRIADSGKERVLSQTIDTAILLAMEKYPGYRDCARAVDFALVATRLGADKPEAWTARGIASYYAGDCGDAITALNESMNLNNGGSAREWLCIAMAHWRCGEKSLARSWLNKSIGWISVNHSSDEEIHRFRTEAEALIQINPDMPNGEEAFAS